MARGQIWEDIYAALLADQALLALLGPVTTDNLRIYRSWPQLQTLLTGYESADEGWLVFDEPETSGAAGTDQLSSIYEVIEPRFSVIATRFSLVDDVLDRLDGLYNWSVEQQRALTFGERIVLFTRRSRTGDTWNAELKLYQKDMAYQMTLGLEEQPV